MQIRFDRGVLLCEAEHECDDLSRLSGAVWHPERRAWCLAPGRYAELQRWLTRRGVAITSQLPDHKIDIAWPPPTIDDFEKALLDTWQRGGHSGALVVPRGAAQTRLALNAIARLGVTTLCLVPDPRVLEHWRRALAAATGLGIAALDVVVSPTPAISVATYSDAMVWAPWFGDRFGLLVVDDSYPTKVPPELFDALVAPARLGLVASLPGPLARLEHEVNPDLEPPAAADTTQRAMTAVWLRDAIDRALHGLGMPPHDAVGARS